MPLLNEALANAIAAAAKIRSHYLLGARAHAHKVDALVLELLPEERHSMFRLGVATNAAGGRVPAYGSDAHNVRALDEALALLARHGGRS